MFGSDRTLTTPAILNFPFSKKAVRNISNTGTATITTRIKIEKISITVDTSIFFSDFDKSFIVVSLLLS